MSAPDNSLTNPGVQQLTGSLWMVTRPGTHASALGRVYRDKMTALTHRDFDEIVVELRLADEPTAEHPAVGLLRQWLLADASWDDETWIRQVRDLVEDGTSPALKSEADPSPGGMGRADGFDLTD